MKGYEAAMYHFNSRVRYSETGEDGCLTLTGIINYFQDCSTFHSEDSGVGVAYLEEHKKAWMLSSWRIFIRRYPMLGEEITVSTWHCGNKGIYGYRNFCLQDRAGIPLAEADSTWFLLDLASGRPCRVKEEDIRAYGTPGEPLDLGKAAGKLALPADAVPCESITVGRHHIDTNHHVNNAQYVEFAREAAGISGPVRTLRADYRRAALLGDVIVPKVSRSPGEATVALVNAQDEPYALVWMQAEGQPFL